MADFPLGKATTYSGCYAPELLYRLARGDLRRHLGFGKRLPFFGEDLWTAYELSWLEEGGKPVVALAEFRIPCDSEFTVESKSFKLYLNSFNQTVFSGFAQVDQTLVRDLSRAVGAPVQVHLQTLAEAAKQPLTALPGISLDSLPVRVERYTPSAELLQTAGGQTVVEETLCSDLLKSNCPVTGQPDWASVQIHYRGGPIDHRGLLRYIISFREHRDFHEHCVERMFVDIMRRCQPEQLTIYARYTRRGGLDINPFRSTVQLTPESFRLPRQ